MTSIEAFVRLVPPVNNALAIRSADWLSSTSTTSSCPQIIPPRQRTMGSTAVLIPDTSLVLETTGGGNDGNWGNNGGSNDRWNDGHDNDERGDSNEWFAPPSFLVVPPKTSVTCAVAIAQPSTFRFPLALLLPMLHWIRSQCYQIPLSTGKQIIDVYMHHLEASPILTKSITSGIMGVLGDVLAQYVEHIRHERRARKGNNSNSFSSPNTIRGGYGSLPFHFNARRSVAILLDGLFISGPLMHLAYDIFEYFLPVAGGTGLNAMFHVLADSLVLDGIFVASAMASSGLLEGYSFRKEVLPQLRQDYLPAWKASVATSSVMAPIQYACFRYLPLSFRVLAMNFTDIIWDAVISFMSHRSRTDGTGHLVHSP